MKWRWLILLSSIVCVRLSIAQVTFEKQYDFWESVELTGVYPLNDGYI